MGTYSPAGQNKPPEKSTSIIDIQREAILGAIDHAGRGDWKVLVLDEKTSKLIYNVTTEDEILKKRITNIQQIEQKRPTDRETDAIYLLTPEPYIVDCLLADLERRRYRKASLLWTSILHTSLRERIDSSKEAQYQITDFKVVDISYHPRESNLVTFRDPWSFPILYHPACNSLVRQHLSDMAEKIVSVCVSLGEYPAIRYYQPPNASHEASVLCAHLARFVQEEIDMYATYHKNFPPASSRPRSTLFIVDRSMDLVAPLVHEFTYQAMVHDLLPLRDGDKVTYKVKVNEANGEQEEKDMEISEHDTIWLANRHRHMKDTIESVMSDFQSFMSNDPIAAQKGPGQNTSLSALKDMMVGMTGFQGKKEAFSLHLTMAQECMNLFEQRKLPDVASIEQTLATRLDEEFKKPKNLTDQVVRTLDEDAVGGPDRLRLLLLFLIYQGGLLPADVTKLLAHAQLPAQNVEVVQNLGLLGQRVSRALKDKTPPEPPILAPPQARTAQSEEYSLSRFEPILRFLLQESAQGTLPHNTFPFTKPQLDPNEGVDNAQQTSLRSAKPTWARKQGGSSENNQRLIVFMAGGATYSEARTCYEVGRNLRKDVYLITSHMLTPGLFIRQVGDLTVDRRRLGLPADQPKPKAPAHLFEREAPPPKANPAPTPTPTSASPAPRPGQDSQPPGVAGRPPPSSQNVNAHIAQMQNMRLDPTITSNGSRPSSSKDEKKHRFFFHRKDK